MKNIFKIFTIQIAILALFTSCAKDEFDAIPPEIGIQTPEWQPTVTIKELLEMVKTQPETDYYTFDTIKSETPVVIEGIVSSEDIGGNVYKYIVVQDPVNYYAIKISFDTGGLSSYYPLGQKVAVKCNGLVLGRYADMLQLGTTNFNSDPDKTMFEPGRIPLPLADKYIKRIGLPDKNNVVIREMTIPEIKAGGPELHSQLVIIKDVRFTGQGADYNKPATIPDSEKIFAPSTGGVGYPQSRVIRDKQGNWIFVATSEYAKFAKKKLPPYNQYGNVTALISWYKKKPSTDPAASFWQLTVRSLDDLEGFTIE